MSSHCLWPLDYEAMSAINLIVVSFYVVNHSSLAALRFFLILDFSILLQHVWVDLWYRGASTLR